MANKRDRAARNSLDNLRDDECIVSQHTGSPRAGSQPTESLITEHEPERRRSNESLAPRRRFPTFTLSVIVALLLLVALAPTLVSFTSLGPQMVA